jgi:pimeloyl-ACP methyl ester carboxylesterase
LALRPVRVLSGGVDRRRGHRRGGSRDRGRRGHGRRAGALRPGRASRPRRPDLHLDILLADWRFAIDVARGRHAAYAARITRFADEIAAALGRPGVDEVLLVGHSLGAVFAVEALAEALRRDPGLLRAGPRFALVGLGPSVLKIALHPAAGRLRAALARLADTPGLVWVDHSSRRDVLSFERSEPIATLGLPGHGPRLERVHPRDMVDAATWSRIRHQPLRIHRQYVLGNTRRYSLDFGLLSCGPLPVESGLRPDRVLGSDGALGAGSAADREASAPVPEPAA